MKKMSILIIMLGLTLRMYAPADRVFYIPEPTKINPYERIWEAVCRIESMNDPDAYHLEENGFASIGIAQIQQSRVDDYNRRTGNSYLLCDMFNPGIAKRVFMHYCGEYKPDQIEIIARLWNGGPNGMRYKQTYEYYLKIKSVYGKTSMSF